MVKMSNMKCISDIFTTAAALVVVIVIVIVTAAMLQLKNVDQCCLAVISVLCNTAFVGLVRHC